MERGMRPETIAASYAAKEAFSKAMGTGVRGFSLAEVSVLRDSLGAPYFALSGRAARLAAERGLCFSVSLTHTDELAAAFVVAWQEGKGGAV
jgi:holo-[acyl-carrier protein] synthase